MVSWNYYKCTVLLLHKNNKVLAQNIICEVRINFTRSFIYMHWISSAILLSISHIQEIILQFTFELLQNTWVISTSPGNLLIFMLFICTSTCSRITSNFRLSNCWINAKKNSIGNLPSFFYSKQTQIFINSAAALSTWLTDGPDNLLVEVLFLVLGPAASPSPPRATAQGWLRDGAIVWPDCWQQSWEKPCWALGIFQCIKPKPLVPVQAML